MSKPKNIVKKTWESLFRDQSKSIDAFISTLQRQKAELSQKLAFYIIRDNKELKYAELNNNHLCVLKQGHDYDPFVPELSPEETIRFITWINEMTKELL